MTNFHPPYINMIPKMLKYYVNVNTTNMIKNFMKDQSYFVSPNSFYLNYIQIGPFTSKKILDIKIQDFLSTNFKGVQKDLYRVEKLVINGEELHFFIIV